MLRWLLLLLLLADSPLRSRANADARARRAERKEWRRAWPKGCREYGRKEAKGRFCSLTPSSHKEQDIDILDREDVVMTISSDPHFKRLRELAAAVDKRQARAKAGEKVMPTAEDHAARAALEAVEAAASKYAKRDSERRELARKRKRTIPAQRQPTEYRCTKVATEKMAAALEFTCSVSDYVTEAPVTTGEENSEASISKVDGKAAAVRESPDERCSKYARWQAEYEKQFDEAKSRVADSFFEQFMSAQHASLGTLEKLRRHIYVSGGEAGRAREVIERKATATYRALSREIHPDKLPKECAKEVEGLMRAIFERADALKNCITKPLRCKLAAPLPTERTCTSGSDSK